jgi:hypothetical protein
LHGKSIDCDVDPIALLAIHDEAILKSCRIRRLTTALRDNIDHEVPRASLACVGECAQDAFAITAPAFSESSSIGCCVTQLLPRVASRERPPGILYRQADTGYHLCEQDRGQAQCEASSASHLRRQSYYP